MPQSLAGILVHLVFSTKHRAPSITDALRPRLHEVAGAILRDLQSPALLMNSVADHVHVSFAPHRTRSLAEAVMELKRATSIWVKDQGPEHADFYWQNGYGAFSIGQSMVNDTLQYIENQADHHKERSFQDEYRRTLELYGIEYDERYMWD